MKKTTAPVIKVARQYYDVTTGEEIQTREEFIESLTHDSYVIQIPYLHPDYKSEVEQLLMIFDQRWITDDKRIMNFKESYYPEKYWQITRRLQTAIATPEVRRIMQAEDEILEEFAMMEQLIAEKDEALDEQRQALDEKDKALDEKDKVVAEQQKMIAELQQQLKDTK
ncbi:hypothetical protein QUF58_07725 [Anaerolineales bacterium HSG24]|nr:hypothetical protein [Anaerolineales bacterium HSG24]